MRRLTLGQGAALSLFACVIITLLYLGVVVGLGFWVHPGAGLFAGIGLLPIVVVTYAGMDKRIGRHLSKRSTKIGLYSHAPRS